MNKDSWNVVYVDMEVDMSNLKKGFDESIKYARDTGKKLDKELILKLEMDYSNLKVAKFEAQQSLNTIRKEYKEWLIDRSKLVEAENAFKRISSETTQAWRLLENYKNTWDKNLSRLQAKFNQVTDEIKLSRKEMKELWLSNRYIKKIEDSTEKLTQEFKKWLISQQKYKDWLRKIRNEATNTESIFWKMGKALIAVFAIDKIKDFFITTSKIAISFESAFAWVNKTLDLTAKEFANMKNWLRELSKEIPLTVEELSWIAEVGWQLWIAKEDILEFTRVAAWLWVATNLTAEQAATAFARISNIMNEPISQMDQMWSALVDLWNNFATNESEILNFAERIAWAWEIAWLTSSEVLGISAAFTSVWIEAESGWTAVQKTLLTINNAVNDSWIELNRFAVVAWMTSLEFAKLWKDNAAQAFNQFVLWLKDSWDDAANILWDLIWTDVRLARAFLSVSWAGDLMTRTIDTSNKAFEENKALIDEVNKRYDTMESKLQIQKNQWKLWWEVIWNDVTPVLISVNDFLVKTLPKTFYWLQILIVWFTWFFVEKFYQMQSWVYWLVSAIQWSFNNMIWIFKDFWANTAVFVRNTWKVFSRIPDLIKESLNKWIEQIEKFINFAWEGINKFAKKLWFEWELVSWISLWRLTVSGQKEVLEEFKSINRDFAREQNKLLIEETQNYQKQKNRQIEINQDATRNFIFNALDKWSQEKEILDKAEDERKEQIKNEIKDEAEKANKILKWLEDLEDKKGWVVKDELKEIEKTKKEALEAEKERQERYDKWLKEKAKKRLETLENQYDSLSEFIDDKIEWFKDNIDEFDDKIKESTDKIKDLEQSLKSLEEWKDSDLSSRFITVREEIEKLQDEIKKAEQEGISSSRVQSFWENTLKNVWEGDLWWWITWNDYLEVLQKQQELNKLLEEQKLIQENIDQSKIDEAIRVDSLSPTEKILEEIEAKKKQYEQDIELETNKIKEFEDLKAIEQENLENFNEIKKNLDEKYADYAMELEAKITDQQYDQLKTREEQLNASIDRQIQKLNELIRVADNAWINISWTNLASSSWSSNNWASTTNSTTINNTFNQNISNSVDMNRVNQSIVSTMDNNSKWMSWRTIS